MIQFEIDDRAVIQALNDLQRRVSDLRPVMDMIGAEIVENIRLGFIDSKSPWGASWKPLKKRQGQPLRDTGKLMNSITHRANADSVVIGTADKAGKALLHQFGSTKAKGRGSGVPARPYLPIRNGQADLPEDWTRSILDIIEDHLRLD